MLREMTWGQFMEWNQYADLEPFGEQREDLRAGIIASSIVNILIQINSDPKKGRPRLTKPADFMPNFDEPQPGTRRARVKPKGSQEIMAGFKNSIYKGLRKKPPANDPGEAP